MSLSKIPWRNLRNVHIPNSASPSRGNMFDANHTQRLLSQRCNAITTRTPSKMSSRPLSTASSSPATFSLIPQSVYTYGARLLLKDVLKLSKYRLSGLVALTAAAGFVCRADPLDHDAQAALRGGPQFYRTLSATTIGTFLTAASANTLNQIYEIRSDALMSRTRSRPLPAGRIGRATAAAFALATGVSGVALLSAASNQVSASLAVANLALYAAVYTPLKAVTTLNTWVGAVVGALPPLIGWTAASDGRLSGDREHGAWVLAALLFLWQIPHFHALAVALRADYAAGGLRMLGVSNPVANANWACVTAAMMLPLGSALHQAGVTNETFVWQSALLSAWMLRASVQLTAAPTSTLAARHLFRTSIWHLPVCMGLMLNSLIPYSERNAIRAAPHSLTDMRATASEIRLHQPWEVIAPFPFLPVPRGAPAIVLDAKDGPCTSLASR